MSSLQFNGSGVGGQLGSLLMAPDITPGDTPSYQLCKTIYAYHPLGAKLAEKPVTLAQSKPRIITVPKGPEAKLSEQFKKTWKNLGCDTTIFNLMALSRVYGVSSVALLCEGDKPETTKKPIDWKNLWKTKIAFNVYDPLNTSGSLVINQIANRMDFMKTDGTITVSGQTYHHTRTCVMMNEQPLYIEFTTSAFGFVGRSVYQRILFPLKSFIQSMMTDDLITLKAGVIIAKLEQPGSIIDGLMQTIFGQKRSLIKEAETYNVLSVGKDEDIETLNLQNLDGAFGMARKDILENIAAGADDMPAQLLNQETFAEGFGEGTEDAAMVAHYIDRIREKMSPAYQFMDRVCMRMAWTPDFYAIVQKEFPDEYGAIDFDTAFYQWEQSFTAEWPSFMEEPPSEQVQVEDVKLKASIAALQVLGPMLDPENRAKLVEWVCDSFNELPLMFGNPLELDYQALLDYTPEQGMEEPEANKPFAKADANTREALAQLSSAVQKLVQSGQPKLKQIAGGRQH